MMCSGDVSYTIVPLPYERNCIEKRGRDGKWVEKNACFSAAHRREENSVPIFPSLFCNDLIGRHILLI